MADNKVTIDGNTAAAHVAYAFSEIAAIYPITPSSNMGELADYWAAHGRKNIFGREVSVIEMQSEAGAAGAVHGSLTAGALTTTFTASQGLLLMIPNMHKIAGEMLPTVFHVSARSLACQSLSIFGDHSDVMSVRNTGFALMAANSVQEVLDLAVVSHLATLESWVPFLNFFDGFRTSHEIQKVDMIEDEILAGMFNHEYLEQFRARALRPEKPMLKVGQQTPDVYFQGRETVNLYYDKTPAIVQKYMDQLAAETGRKYNLFDYVGHPEAERIVVAMGSACETIEETVSFLAARGEKVGLLKVRLYRPFAVEAFRKALPASVRKIAVLDRTKEPGAIGEPLYLDVVAALKGRDLLIIGGRYGLSSKEFTPAMAKAVFDHLAGPAGHGFTVGINDDVSGLSIPVPASFEIEKADTIKCIFWGLGSDGTVGANKNSIKIIGDHTDMYAQGYFSYDSKKSGGITVSYLRFGKTPIRAPYLPTSSDFTALHNVAYIGRYDILKELKEGGTFLLNSEWSNEDVFNHLTREMQETIIRKKIKMFNINALKISEEVGLGKRINSVMQAAFFIISGVLPEAEAIELIKDAIKKTYDRKGEDVVKMNWEAVDRTKAALQQVPVPARVEDIRISYKPRRLVPDNCDEFTCNIIEKMMHLKGDAIPVSHMPLDGTVPTATSRLEKRGIAPHVPRWLSEHCIQCNQCSLVCPHAAIRAKQIAPADLTEAPAAFNTLKSTTKNERDLQFRIQVYIEDCTGCGNCLQVCPSKVKALEWSSIEEERNSGQNDNVAFFEQLPDNVLDGANLNQIKGSQFRQPLFEFSGACAGCGETPYVKLLTQLFGERMLIANATGCSSIYGGTFPTTPYSVSKEGFGPVWANSLFEDNAEYGFGMRLAVDANRAQLRGKLEELLSFELPAPVKTALQQRLDNWTATDEAARTEVRELKKMLAELKVPAAAAVLRKINELQDYLLDKSIWCLGGDGWAYDIGYGGLDHVLAADRNVNVLVMDTEVYSNTGGQASKSTPLGAVAQFASSGKRTGKKDLGLMLMSYGYVYIASIALGANMNQAIKAFLEAEAYPGPSIILAYSPCIAHGIDMGRTIETEKRAVNAGYWPLFRYNPLLTDQGKNPFVYETKDPSEDMMAFLESEIRYSTLKNQFPEAAEKLFAQAVAFRKQKHEFYKKLAAM